MSGGYPDFQRESKKVEKLQVLGCRIYSPFTKPLQDSD